MFIIETMLKHNSRPTLNIRKNKQQWQLSRPITHLLHEKLNKMTLTLFQEHPILIYYGFTVLTITVLWHFLYKLWLGELNSFPEKN